MSETMQTTLAEFEKGDEITFNDRVQPLTVERVHESEVTDRVSVRVRGSRGGEYRLVAGDRDDPTVSRVVDSCSVTRNVQFTDERELERVDVIATGAEVEPPVEIGDQFKQQTELDCVDHTGEWWGYEVTAIDRENHTVEIAYVHVPESTDATAWVTHKELDYVELEDRLEKWTAVDDLESDADAAPNRDVETGEFLSDQESSEGDREIATEGGVDVEPIKIRWSGDARSKFKGRKVRARQADGHWTGELALETLDRLKTRVVVKTEREALALEDLLSTMARSRYSWTTDNHVAAFERVLNELREGMAERGWTDDEPDVDGDDQESGDDDREIATDGGAELPLEGDVVELPNGSRFIVDAIDRERLEPDRYHVREVESGKSITWRTHHVETALETGGELVSGGFVWLDADDLEPVVVTDGGWISEPSTAWCPECQRERVSCAHMDDAAIATDGGTASTKSPSDAGRSMDVDDRATELEETTALKRREAEVQARKERGDTHQEIADALDLSKSTVDEYSRRINQRIAEARATIAELED